MYRSKLEKPDVTIAAICLAGSCSGGCLIECMGSCGNSCANTCTHGTGFSATL